MLIHASLYVCLSVPPCQSVVTGRGVQHLRSSNAFCKGVLSPEPVATGICALGEVTLGTEGVQGSFWAAAPISEAQTLALGKRRVQVV